MLYHRVVNTPLASFRINAKPPKNMKEFLERRLENHTFGEPTFGPPEMRLSNSAAALSTALELSLPSNAKMPHRVEGALGRSGLVML